jgi:hypothetical protein
MSNPNETTVSLQDELWDKKNVFETFSLVRNSSNVGGLGFLVVMGSLRLNLCLEQGYEVFQ